ncbi:pentatricopeptide repeat-containing protein At3g23020-like [Durio zibethinus]|uniref:Pentatricopeptide repeat-containing protein At3g23020-like n=1 Tax=Durio zibethinus TaxID=66656 RepID=A0A6P5X0V0_DURZI|nr:pentatricopeptide repeat-containing protein At3g23020-like [Durio zibethinus]
MLAKLPLDSSCFNVLCSSKTTPPNITGASLSISVSVSPIEKLEPITKSNQQILVGTHNGGGTKKFNGVRKQSLDNQPEPSNQILEKNPDSERREKTRGSFKFMNKRGKFGTVCGKFPVEKLQAKCSTKWASYGGCIPAILGALDSVKDLDEALKPWAEKLSNKERSIILKEQSSWERAVEIFEWFKRKQCYEFSVIHYNIMFRILGKAHKWGYVERLWNEMSFRGIEPINSTYGTLIDVYSKSGMKQQALCWLGKMNKQGMEPDEVTMGSVVQLYKKAGEFQKAEEFFKKWSLNGSSRNGGSEAFGAVESDSPLRSYTYNILIDTYGKAGQLQEASETFEMMLREGIVPTTVTFNTMIHICGNHGQLEEVASLMKKMEEVQCLPDTRTYNILISLHAKHDDIKMAAGYFAKMKEACLEPDLVSFRTLLYAYSIRQMVSEAEDLIQEMDERHLEIDEYTQSALTRMYIEAGMLEKSWLWFMRFHLAGNMRSEGYSANIDAFGERGHVFEAEKIFVCCQERKKLTVLEFNVMIKAYGIGKGYDKACWLLDSMLSHGVVPDKCSYSSLIQILASADLPHVAKCYLKKMQEAGLVNDCIPYCAVISSFVKLGELEMAEGLYSEMIQNKVEPDVVVYGVLINAFADLGSVKEAMNYVNAMKSAGIPGNAVIYNSLIKLYTKVGYLKEAQEVYKLLQLSGFHTDMYSSNCMIDLYSKRSMVSRAEAIFENLKQKGDANEFTYAMMLCMYKRNGRFEEATRIARQMRELGLLTDLLSYNNVLGLYAMDGRFREAVRIFKEMVSAWIQPDDSTFKSLGSVLMKCGVPKQAVNRLQVAREKDTRSGLQAWMATLSSVVGMDEDDDDYA